MQPLQRKVCQACFSCPGSLRATIRTLSSVDVCVKTAKTCVRIAFDRLGAYGKVSANKRKERQCFVVLKVLGIHLTIGAIVIAVFFFFSFNPSLQLIKLWGFIFLSLRVSPSFLCDFRGLCDAFIRAFTTLHYSYLRLSSIQL